MNTFTLLNRMNELVSELPNSNDYSLRPYESESFNKFIEDENSYKIKLNLAGASKESIKVSLHENMLTVLARTDDDIDYHYKCHLPNKNVEAQKTETKYENGILSLNVPKKTEAKPISIKVT